MHLTPPLFLETQTMSIFGSFANVNQVNPLNNLEYADLLFVVIYAHPGNSLLI